MTQIKVNQSLSVTSPEAFILESGNGGLRNYREPED